MFINSMSNITVVLATYRPNLEYIKKQLISIDNQNYTKLDLIVCDDSDNSSYFQLIEKILKETIKNKKFSLIKNEKNIGSNKTFEKLTLLASGEYIAYCDQDDIWEPDKLNKLYKELQDKKALVCYSDLSIINEKDEKIADSFKEISKRLEHIYGENKFDYFIRRNSITGCTMLIDSSTAKSSLPFPDYKVYVHDHWLALFASLNGRVAYVKEPLVQYRIHANNQIGSKILDGINKRDDYFNKKLLFENEKVELLKKRKLNRINPQILSSISDYEEFVQDRINMFNKKNIKNIVKFLKYFPKDKQLILFEFAIFLLPEYFVKKILQKIK
ncbi:glycosyltransferase family 2 protein [Peribacillus cavernae]|uniref:Glycosyltransferase family 2 protein n=1 Tax=Peribacillus cavernae TaxID=1674310 RepID=A0A433HE20_9BACI|nr:glycosyltransferase family 2 protein [Peribacillus cavernae]MDQ0221228.1 GT2 family glycosyltransferase [Peribacillus cavernae]RUQ26556.1 glycosyltransferase family 2 protein [Peribacillus cavernae]